MVRDVLREEALGVFRAYREGVDAGGSTVYNARQGTTAGTTSGTTAGATAGTAPGTTPATTEATA